MKLYLVVHHKDDEDQIHDNEWETNRKIRSIETNSETGFECRYAMETKQRVFFHRCRFESDEPTICCHALVREVVPIPDSKYCRVYFEDVQSCYGKPPGLPHGHSHYYA
jgi:hypothetical protein